MTDTFLQVTSFDPLVVQATAGATGQDGRGIESAVIDGSNHLIITLTDNSTIDVGDVGGSGGLSSVSSADITDATTVGKAVLTATDAAAARTAVGAGTSSLALGTTSTTALAGDGTAAAATKLATARNINGVAFDGTANVTVADSTKVPTTRTVAGHDLSADVTLSSSDVGLGSVDNTADASKPVSTAQQAAIDTSPAFIVESGGSYALRSTVTSNSSRMVIWVGPDAPAIGGGYAITGLDKWFVTP